MLSSNTFNTPTICSVLCGSIFLCGSSVFVRSRFGRLDIDCFRHCQRVSASRLETFPNYRACTQVRGLVVNLRHHEDPSRRQTVKQRHRQLLMPLDNLTFSMSLRRTNKRLWTDHFRQPRFVAERSNDFPCSWHCPDSSATRRQLFK